MIVYRNKHTDKDEEGLTVDYIAGIIEVPLSWLEYIPPIAKLIADEQQAEIIELASDAD